MGSSSAYSGVTFVDSFSVASQETSPSGIAFNSDGTKMFVIGWNGDDVNEYHLSTGFDVSTAAYDSNFSVSSQETHPMDIAFNSDGTKMFMLGFAGKDVNEYTLSTGFDVSTSSFVDSFSVASQETSPRGIAFNSDGTKMFVIGNASKNVNEYTLSTGFDVSTSSFVDSFSVVSQETSPRGIAFNSDGTKMFVLGHLSNNVHEYTLSTGFNLFTANPILKKDVIGSIEAWSDISSSWANSNIKSAQGRIDWLNRHKGSNQTSYQGIQINFADTLINKIMNNTSGEALQDIDAVDTASSLIENSDGSASEVGDNAEQKATDIAINEAVRLREGLIGSLNPSFGPLTGNWSVWTEGEVTIGKTDASTTASKKKASAQAISLGFDRPIRSGNELMGFVFSAGQNDTDIGTASTSVKSNNYSLLNYTVFNTKGAQLESVFGIGQLDFDTTRTDGSDALTGTRKANQLLFSSTIRPQRTINLGNWHLSPYTKVSLTNTRLNSFSESGAATALTFNKQEIKDGALGVGFDISTLIKNQGNTIQPFVKIEYARSSSKTSASMHYNDEDASLYNYTTSLNKSSNNWKMKLGFDLNTKSNWDMSLVYIREQSKGSSDGSKSSSNGLSFNAALKF